MLSRAALLLLMCLLAAVWFGRIRGSWTSAYGFMALSVVRVVMCKKTERRQESETDRRTAHDGALAAWAWSLSSRYHHDPAL